MTDSDGFASNSVTQCECAAVPPPTPLGCCAEGLRFFEQYIRDSDLEAAQKSIDIYQSLLLVTEDGKTPPPEQYPRQVHADFEEPSHVRIKRYHALIYLARILHHRYLFTSDISDIQSALRHSQAALETCRAERISCPTILILHADVLHSFTQIDHPADTSYHHTAYRDIEALYRDAVLLCGIGHPLRASAYRGLAKVLRGYFGATMDGTFINEAVELQRQALDAISAEDPSKHLHLHSLGWYLFTRHDYSGESRDMDEACRVIADATQLCPPLHIERPNLVSTVLSLTYRRSYQSGRVDNRLNEDICLGRKTINACPQNSAARRHVMDATATLLYLRYQLTGSPEENDLEEMVAMWREIYHLQQSHIGGQSTWLPLFRLSVGLYMQFVRYGRHNDLEEAIQTSRQAAELLHNHPRQSHPARILAEMLVLRFAETGDIANLTEALQWDRRVMKLISPTDASFPTTVVTMISHLCTRFESLGTTKDLEEAIPRAEELLNSLSSEHANTLDAIYVLSKTLLLRGRHVNDLADIDRAIAVLEPVADTVSHRPNRLGCLRTLAACHLTRFRLAHNDHDALHALEIMVTYSSTVRVGYRERYEWLLDTAELYMEQGTPYRNLSLSLKHLSDALAEDNRDPRSRIQDAARILNIIHSDGRKSISSSDQSIQSQLLDICSRVIGLLPRVALLGLQPQSRLESLKASQKIANMGAVYALNLQGPEKALEILEQGRAIFWTHSLRLRSPFDAVPGELRDRLSSLARQLERSSEPSEAVQDQRAVDAEAARRRRQSEEFDTLLSEVRDLPGLGRFLLHDEFPALAKVAERGPVVVLVSSKLACHAIIIKPYGQINSLPLAQITEDWVVQSGISWRSVVTETRSTLRDRLKVSQQRPLSTLPCRNTVDILRHLWVTAVGPILRSLEIEPSLDRDRPRIWWCPTGPFVHLPLHAAGADDSWCSDYVVSSYTPTLGALIAARATHTPVEKRDVRALIAAVPHSNWRELASASDEALVVRASLPANAKLVAVASADEGGAGEVSGITARALLDSLPEATILHLACHGYQDPVNPLKSGFVMRDEMLTIERLMLTPLPHAFMAFLSACETAKGDKNQPDQTVHLAATMLFAGFKSVIATLWSMEDVDGPAIAHSVYKSVFGGDSEALDPDDIPYALDAAVQQLRREHPDPSRWAPYIHLGI